MPDPFRSFKGKKVGGAGGGSGGRFKAAPMPTQEGDVALEREPIGGVPPTSGRSGRQFRSGGSLRSGLQAARPRAAITPRYFVGDELKPARWSPDRIADLQRKLVGIGLLPKKGFQLGFWDINSQKAYAELLSYANASGMSDMQTLANYEGIVSKFGGPADEESGGRQRAPLVVQLTNPEDLKAVAEGVATKTIGRKLRDDEIQNFISTFHSQQRSAQEQDYALGDIEASGGTVTAPPDPSVAAQKYAKEKDPFGHYEVGMLDRHNQFLQLLGTDFG